MREPLGLPHLMDFVALAFKSMWYLIRGTLVKAMVFPEVMYGCESWTAKKAEHQRIDALLGGKKVKIKNHLKK